MTNFLIGMIGEFGSYGIWKKKRKFIFEQYSCSDFRCSKSFVKESKKLIEELISYIDSQPIGSYHPQEEPELLPSIKVSVKFEEFEFHYDPVRYPDCDKQVELNIINKINETGEIIKNNALNDYRVLSSKNTFQRILSYYF